ncbi:MAG: mechanosensitive ion channel family protein [Thermoplasmata archaeon]|nr:MAG: mechanosensitive ion channel family protein [Thermoplasmata archaeon]
MMSGAFSNIANQISKELNIPPIAGELILSMILFALAALVGWVVYLFFERYLKRWAERTETKLDDMILQNIRTPIYILVLIMGIYYAITPLSILKPYSDLVSALFSVIQILGIAFISTRVLNVLVEWYAESRAEKGKRLSEHLLFIFKKLIQAVVYIFAFLAILAAFNIDLTNVIVGLGVGGIAIALALQNILSDVFSAFSIYFDRPFEVGDFIVIGDYMGTVKKIGIKSTRIQLLQGEELVVSNKDLVNEKIRNFKKMKKRRISFIIGVTYDTPIEKLRKIPEIIREIIDPKKLPDVDQLERVHFKEFGPYSLNFEIVYYLKTRDYIKYMDTQQAINFAIKEAFEKEGIEMAFPTQTIYLNKTETKN